MHIGLSLIQKHFKIFENMCDMAEKDVDFEWVHAVNVYKFSGGKDWAFIRINLVLRNLVP